MTREPALPYIWMLLGALAFATMGALTHALGEQFDWQIIALVRTLVALVLASTLAWAAGAKFVFWKPGTLWVRSLAGSVSLVCTFFALTRLPVADVLTLTNIFPLWIALLSWPLLHEPPAAQVWLAIASGLCGVALIQQPHLADGNYASLAAIVSSLTTALAMLGLHRLHRIDPRAIVVHFSAVSLVVCLASLVVCRRSMPLSALWNGWSVLMLVAVGVTATIGQLFLTKAFAAGPPAKISVVALAQVAFGLVYDVIIWGRSLNLLTLLGMAFVLAPCAWLMIRRSAASTLPSDPGTPVGEPHT